MTWRTSGEDSFAAGLRCPATDFEPALSRYQARLKPRYGSLALARQGAAPERPGNAARPSGSGRPRARPSRPPYLPEPRKPSTRGGSPPGARWRGLKNPRPRSERRRPYLPRTLGGSCRAEKRGALPGGGLRRHGGAPGVGPRRPATRLGAARGSRVEEAATLRERVTRVGPSTVPNRRPPRGRPLRQVGASHIPCLGRRYSGKNAAYLKRVIAITHSAHAARLGVPRCKAANLDVVPVICIRVLVALVCM